MAISIGAVVNFSPTLPGISGAQWIETSMLNSSFRAGFRATCPRSSCLALRIVSSSRQLFRPIPRAATTSSLICKRRSRSGGQLGGISTGAEPAKPMKEWCLRRFHVIEKRRRGAERKDEQGACLATRREVKEKGTATGGVCARNLCPTKAGDSYRSFHLIFRVETRLNI